MVELNVMVINGQRIIPAIRNLSELKLLIEMSYHYIVVLNSHISELKLLAEWACNLEEGIRTICETKSNYIEIAPWKCFRTN